MIVEIKKFLVTCDKCKRRKIISTSATPGLPKGWITKPSPVIPSDDSSVTAQTLQYCDRCRAADPWHPINGKDDLPPPGKTVIIQEAGSGYRTRAYLCPCCSNEWRCPVTGGMLLVNAMMWMEDEDEDEVGTGAEGIHGAVGQTCTEDGNGEGAGDQGPAQTGTSRKDVGEVWADQLRRSIEKEEDERVVRELMNRAEGFRIGAFEKRREDPACPSCGYFKDRYIVWCENCGWQGA